MMFRLGLEETRLPSLDLASTPSTTAPSAHTQYFSSSDQLSNSANALHDVSSSTSVSIPYSKGTRSAGQFPHTRSRNVKQYEEDLDRLHKENSDLRIRIFLLEEKLGTQPQKFEKNGLKKANIELQMETTDLKKMLKEKHDLVQNASKLLLVLDTQYKNELDQVRESHVRQTAELKEKISQLEKDLVIYSNNGDLTQLCDLAFKGVEEGEITSAFNKSCQPLSASSVPKGIFSISNGTDNGTVETEVLSHASNRIKQLEEQMVALETKIGSLKEQLGEKERTSKALEEDVINLKKELEDREEKVSDLEMEVNEKDQKVDQLMQNLETRHLEIQAKDTTIQTLHDDLNKVEPEIEVKVHQIMDRDKVIEEKMEQLQHQNKILVEIQITLDEKQKQIAELEAQLREEQDKCEKANNELNCSCEAIKLFLDKNGALEKEASSLRKELKRKEKKIRDLVAELKEALELVNKAKWEAETSGCEDGVKEMAEEENERVWAELEQKKLDIIALKEQLSSAAKEADEKILRLQNQAEDSELKLKNLQKLVDENRQKPLETSGGASDVEVAALKEKLESRDASLKGQQSLIDSLKGELGSTRAELSERKLEMKELKTLLFQKNADVQDFITKELLGRSQEVRDLQGKLCGLAPSGQDAHLDILKMFLEAKNLEGERKEHGAKDCVPSAQARSNSLSNVAEKSVAKTDRDNSSSQSGSKAGRSNSFSLLENALYAQMGQKVYNTNQTFNTYVLSGESDKQGGTDRPPFASDHDSVLPTEALKKELGLADPCEAKALLSNILSKSKDKNFHPQISSHKTSDEGDSEAPSLKAEQPILINPQELKFIIDEMGKLKRELQSLRQEREVLTLQVSSLHKRDSLEREPSEEANIQLQKQLHESHENTIMKDQMASDIHFAIEGLKEQVKGNKKKIVLKTLELTSNKYQESLQKYKQEIISLRKRLADSHNACNILRNRLEELVEFLEQIVDLEKRGKLSLSHLSNFKRNSLQKTLDDSRALSQSLSHSLMIGMDSILEDESSMATHFEVPLDELTEEIDLVNLSTMSTAALDNQSRFSDVSTTCHKEVIQALLASEMDSKTEETDAIIMKLNQLSNAIQAKDNFIQQQTEFIESLHPKLQYQLQSRDLSLSANPQSVNCVSAPISSVIPNQSNSSLHLSALDHSASLFNPDSEAASSESTALTPSNVSFFSSQEDSIKENLLAVNCEDNLSVLDPDAKSQAPLLNLASPSESEAWSEPDRNVSMARIGLDASNLVGSNHDRSRSRNAKSAPFTSESEGETHLEENRDGTPCGKPKRRTEATEIKRLASKLRNVEQMNDTLRAELHIYQTLSQHFSNKPCPQTNDKSIGAFESDAPETESSVTIPSSLFQEIRCLRRKLEEAITNNDLLRDQLEAALSGYLSEETRNLTGKLSSAQQEISLQQEQLISAATIERQLQMQLQETDAQVFELNERLSHYLSSSEKMDKKIQQLNKDLKAARENISLLETKMNETQLEVKNKSKNIETQNLKIRGLETENCSMRNNLERMTEIKIEKETLIEELNSYIMKNEEKTKNLESHLRHLEQQENPAHKDRIASLEATLQDSEQKRLEASKDNLALVQDVKKLTSKLESCKAQSDILKMEARDSNSEKEIDNLHKKLGSSHSDNHQLLKEKETFKKENLALQKEMKLLQEEVAALRSHLDHVLARESRMNQKENLSLLRCNPPSSLQTSYSSLQNCSSFKENVNNSELDSEWQSLKNQLNFVKPNDADLQAALENLKQKEFEIEQLSSQLEAEQRRTDILHIENNSLQSKLKSIRENSYQERHGSSTSLSLTSVELIRNIDLGSRKNKEPVRPSSISWTENKENRIPSTRNFDDDEMSGDSPDLGIGSDGHFSSLERLNQESNRKEPASQRLFKLCSDQSHSRLKSENEDLRKDQDSLNLKLKRTKETLQETLDQLSKANLRTETVEKAVILQLSKTHDVLRQASGNLRQAKQPQKKNGET